MTDPIALWNAKQSDYFARQDALGLNDRADVTSGSGISRFDTGPIEATVNCPLCDRELTAELEKDEFGNWWGEEFCPDCGQTVAVKGEPDD